MNKRRILFNEKDDLEIIESFRTLRTNLSFLNEKETGRKILFTSVIPNEGKSFLSSNYAASIASTDKKVLLIDCDIRRPRAHKSFEVKFENGLESVLLGKASVEETILKDVIPNLDMLPSKYIGEGVTELFSGHKIGEILESLSPHYNTIILDNPPIAVATDSVLLSKFVDGVVVVVGYDQVSKKELEFAKEMLNNAHANIYGFVVNKVDKSGLSYGNYGYYNNYYSYYKEYYEDDHVRVSHEHRHKKITKFEKLIHKFSKEYIKQLKGDLKGRRK